MTQTILVTGSNGQLATCIKDLEHSRFRFIYTSRKELDISSKNDLESFFKTHKIDWVINCAAYTAVDNAETDVDNAFKVNEEAIKNLADICKNHNSKLIHISTDFVFDGNKNSPYNEDDKTNPLGVYGNSKLKGEEAITQSLKRYFIIRTSWLYSEHGNNFMKTMIRLGNERDSLGVVGDQLGTPTYAKDLADAILNIVNNNSEKYGIYHYSNEGEISWYDFAKAIFEISNIEIDLKNISTTEFPTPAKRPKYSVLDKSKIKTELNIKIPEWRNSLERALQNLKNA